LCFFPWAGLRLPSTYLCILFTWGHRYCYHTWLVCWEGGLTNTFPKLASNLNSPYLHFQSI
jgi:hypothetical protein